MKIVDFYGFDKDFFDKYIQVLKKSRMTVIESVILVGFSFFIFIFGLYLSILFVEHNLLSLFCVSVFIVACMMGSIFLFMYYKNKCYVKYAKKLNIYKKLCNFYYVDPYNYDILTYRDENLNLQKGLKINISDSLSTFSTQKMFDKKNKYKSYLIPINDDNLESVLKKKGDVLLLIGLDLNLFDIHKYNIIDIIGKDMVVNEYC